MVYSRDTATLRFHYDESHPNAYGYYYAASVPSATTPWAGNLHGGGFSQPGYDEDNERDPSAEMTNSAATLDAIAGAGGAIFVLEFPQGGHVSWDGRGYACSKFPENWLVVARAIQFIKDNAGPGGLWEDEIDPDDGALICSSSGALVGLMSQWAPDSWGMIPRAPGAHVALGNALPKASHRVKALVLSGPPINAMQVDPGRAISSSYAPLPVVLASPYSIRPRLALVGTVSGTISVGDRLQLQSDTTVNGEVYSISGGNVQYLVEGGSTADLADTDVMEKVGATANTLTLTADPTIEDKHGWYEISRDAKEAFSPVLLLDEMTSADMEAARAVAIYAQIGTNPTVQFQAADVATATAARAMITNKYGVDDAYDIAYLEHKLGALTGFTTEFYWGQAAATLTGERTSQQITAATNASPIVCTTSEEHGIQTGDTIQVGQGLGNTAMNGTWTATRISSTQFSLDTTSGNGTYTSGGVWAFHNAGGNYGSQHSATTVVDFLRDDAGLNLA